MSIEQPSKDAPLSISEVLGLPEPITDEVLEEVEVTKRPYPRQGTPSHCPDNVDCPIRVTVEKCIGWNLKNDNIVFKPGEYCQKILEWRENPLQGYARGIGKARPSNRFTSD